MIRATTVRPPHSFPDSAIADRVVLDYDDRHRRRMAMEGVEGTAFLLDLAEAVPLVSDSGLELEDGRIVLVVAAAEPLLEIRAKNPDHMVRIAWHLGNRHLPTQILGAKLRIRRDHVIEDMVKGLGARVVAIEGPFDPEGGAYGHGTVTGHDHHHDHDHDHHHGHHHHGHDHGAAKSRDVLSVRSPGHVHDAACGCGHDHGHHHAHGHDHDHGRHDDHAHHHDHGHHGHDHKHRHG